MTIDWDKLKPNFDLRGSFEELCCQLARYEQVPSNSIFVRKAPPDAGVECFWKFPNNDEWGWQAKFFRSPPRNSQWVQIDDSIKKALNKHPNLKKYTICLPIDRNDPRKIGSKSFLDSWNEHLKKWKKWKRNIEFDFWGNSEILDRLSREQHQGRYKFFFEKEFLTQQWFENHLRIVKSTAGPRYSPELNVNLPLAKIFDSLGRTTEFYNQLKRQIPKINKQYSFADTSKAIKETGSKFSELRSKLDKINLFLRDAENSEQTRMNFQEITSNCITSQKIIDEIISILEEKNRELAKGKKDPYTRIDDFDSELYHLWNLQKIMRGLAKWFASDSCLVSNTGALLLRGNAGTGKTHLFCDVAQQRILSNRPTVVIFGSHFSNDNPKSQILRELDLSGTFESFLQALDAAGQANNSKSILMIDALNEGEGQRIWPKYLPELLTTLSNYPWVGIAISIRTSYEAIVIPQHLDAEMLSKFTHIGFGEQIEEATKIFFENNGIQRPSIPLLINEFSNPQFLLVLCRGLKAKGLTKIPKGLKGLTAVYDFFIDAVNDKLSGIEFFNYPSHKKIVQQAIRILSEHMANDNQRYIDYNSAEQYLNQVYSSSTISNSLLENLISEGILSQEIIRTTNDEYAPAIQFAYERFGDNLIVKNLLEKINKRTLKAAFRRGGILEKYFHDEASCCSYRGIIEAASIQIPEKFGNEIIEIKPTLSKFVVIIETLLDSLMWRNPKSIKNSTLYLVEKYALRGYLDRFLKILLTVSGDPETPLNAIYFHKHLLKNELGARDEFWSTFLHYNYYEEDSIVRRYIEWAWKSDKAYLSTDSIFLSGLTLTWFLTSSNRFVRDRATKALVALLTEHLGIMKKILQNFTKCNDPYVIERLYAVAYGTIMRNHDPRKVEDLANCVYEQIFKTGNPPADIALRDHAKGIIDYAMHLGLKLKINYENVTPPYKSEWISIPPAQEIQRLEAKSKGTPQIDNGGWMIFHSLGTMGDFSRYTLGTNSNHFDWTSVPLLPGRIPRERLFQKFEKTITNKQKIAWANYHILITEKESFRNVPKRDRKRVFGTVFEDDEFEQFVSDTKKYLRKSLSKNQKSIFDKYVSKYLEESISNSDFNLALFERWIIKKVFDLGWSKERFGQFDQFISHNWSHRNANKPERMGKKYQWIAYNELLARVADNFEFRGDFSTKRKFREYLGIWNLIGGRDIDPSLTMSRTHEAEGYSESQFCWWFPTIYDAWNFDLDDVDWLKSVDDLPNFKDIIEIKKSDESTWLSLGGEYDISQPTPMDQDRYEIPRRHIWFHLRSYLVKKDKIDKIFRWAKKQSYHGIRLPDYDSTYETYLGEMYWAPSVQQIIRHGEPTWVKHGDSSEKLPAEIYNPVYAYIGENSGYDCSLDNNIRLILPNKLLVEKMSLHNKINGMFVDKNNKLIAFDPIISETGPGALLIDKNSFSTFLESNDYQIVWTLIGQKQILGEHDHNNWKGQLEIYAVYRIKNNKIIGIVKTEYVDRALADKRNRANSI